MPRQFAHQASSSPNALSAVTTAPPTTSLWPLRYFVVECTTTSAPSAIGCCSAGDRKVLSTTTRRAHGVRRAADPADVGDAQQRIARRLDPDDPRAARCDDVRRIRRREIGEHDVEEAALRQRPKQSLRSAVTVVRGDDDVARLQEMKDERHGGHPRARDHAAPAPPSSSASASASWERVGLPLRV